MKPTKNTNKLTKHIHLVDLTQVYLNNNLKRTLNLLVRQEEVK